MSEGTVDRSPWCIGYRDDGTLCREPATILDRQRGGMVCSRHNPDRRDRCGWSDGDLTITDPPEEDV